jgi:hypothetical protein
LQSVGIFGLALLYQAKSLSENFAGILIAARDDELFDQPSLMVGENDITGWHMDLKASKILA